MLFFYYYYYLIGRQCVQKIIHEPPQCGVLHYCNGSPRATRNYQQMRVQRMQSINLRGGCVRTSRDVYAHVFVIFLDKKNKPKIKKIY